MLKQHIAWVLLLCAALTYSSCEQIIEIELPEHQPQLVLDCTFQPDSLMRAQVSFSRAIQDTTTLAAVENALLLVYEDGVFWDTLARTATETPWPYSSTKFPQAGRSYTLKASAPGYPAVEGSDRIPTRVPAVNVVRKDSVVGTDGSRAYSEVSFSFDDPAGLGDAYVVGIFFKDSLEFEPGVFQFQHFVLYTESDDPVLEQSFRTSVHSFSDNTFDGRRHTIKLRIYTGDLDYGDAYLGFAHVSDHYIRYMRTLSKQLDVAFNPFAEPVIVHSNMSAKMGIFAGYAESVVPIP